ncbi:MAG: restriction endonuclease [Promethearchaeota archaeon]
MSLKVANKDIEGIEEEESDLKKVSLEKIAEEYFSRRYEFIKLKKALIGKSGQKWKFDGIIKNGDQTFGVRIKDWGRVIGVNQVRFLEKACIDMGFTGGLLVSNNFSTHAITYGSIKGVQLVSKSELYYKYKYN